MARNIRISGATTGVDAIPMTDVGKGLGQVGKGLGRVADATANISNKLYERDRYSKELAKKTKEARDASDLALWTLEGNRGWNELNGQISVGMDSEANKKAIESYYTEQLNKLTETQSILHPDDYNKRVLQLEAQKTHSLAIDQSNAPKRDAIQAKANTDEAINIHISNGDVDGAIALAKDAEAIGIYHSDPKRAERYKTTVDFNGNVSILQNADSYQSLDDAYSKIKTDKYNQTQKDNIKNEYIKRRNVIIKADQERYKNGVDLLKVGGLDSAYIETVQDPSARYSLTQLLRIKNESAGGIALTKTNVKNVPTYTNDELTDDKWVIAKAKFEDIMANGTSKEKKIAREKGVLVGSKGTKANPRKGKNKRYKFNTRVFIDHNDAIVQMNNISKEYALTGTYTRADGVVLEGDYATRAVENDLLLLESKKMITPAQVKNYKSQFAVGLTPENTAYTRGSDPLEFTQLSANAPLTSRYHSSFENVPSNMRGAVQNVYNELIKMEDNSGYKMSKGMSDEALNYVLLNHDKFNNKQDLIAKALENVRMDKNEYLLRGQLNKKFDGIANPNPTSLVPTAPIKVEKTDSNPMGLTF